MRMTEGEVRTLAAVLSDIERKFRYDTESERFVFNPQGSVMSIEFSGYARLSNLLDKCRTMMMKGRK